MPASNRLDLSQFSSLDDALAWISGGRDRPVVIGDLG
jgi:hypothetical protein